MIEIIVYIIVVIFVVMWCYFKWHNRPFEKLAARMPGPPAYPFIGTLYGCIGLTSGQIVSRILDYVKDYNLEPFKFWMGPYFGVFIVKPEDLQIVLNSSNAFQKGFVYDFFKVILGEGLFTAPVDKWRIHRRMISPFFNGKLLEQFFPVFIEKNRILIRNVGKQLNETQVFNLWDYVAPFALDVICENTMGYNLDTQTNKNECEFAKAIVKFPLQVIKEKKAEFDQRKKLNDAKMDVTNSNEHQSKLFLDTLFELNNGGGNFSDSDIRDEVITMLAAGSETNAITVCFCLLLLAIHQDIQDKVYDEIYDIFDESDHMISIEDTSRLVYLEQVLKETLRLLPAAPFLLREIQEDLKIFSSDYVLPKGTMCIISPLATHRSPDLYSNPRDFNPENFSPENIAKRHRYSFIPFSGGPRGCIGSKYVMMVMKVTVSTFLRHFSVHTNIKLTDIKLKLDVLMRSVDGYPVTIRPRDKRPTYKRNLNSLR
ncbi:cytochrome P450 4C1 [Acyrthosiphon pisum]|uniref:Cytochrome P450 n=1 Tax=Acyrthosiphon pisum TaxID=7029 RepID=A0A8R2D2B7_ACYPI|nr:cytochrome P450 4C1 [Acyrthosiphon pisum]|eukprot:XP_016656341.1 PREDICTED: cytochrome P450 4C1-like [Acyrthosiphon pisum]